MRACPLRFTATFLFASIALSPALLARAQTAPPAGVDTSQKPASVSSGVIKHVGNGVSSPILVQNVEPQYTEPARKAGISGDVLLKLQVDERGLPSHVSVLRGLGMGLDENAVRAVEHYTFKPAMEDGKPIAVEVNILVSFKLTGGAPLPPYASDPKFIASIAEGKKLAARGDWNFAADDFRKANKIAGGKCVECLYQIVKIQSGLGNFKDAITAANDLIALAATPADKSDAERLLGQTLYAQGGEKPKPAQLEAANNALKAAIVDFPGNVAARFCDGTVLARMGQTEEAKQQFEACLGLASPSDPSYLRAQHFAANPEMSYAKMAPAFTVTALDGSKFQLDAMGGRVVLIDFWATWCGPCNAELPHMKKIAKEFAGQPLVIISVSWDDDETAWKNFINKNEMTWTQYRDAGHSLSKAFGVHEIPHYFTISSDGVLTAEMMGSGSDVESKLKKLVAKAKAPPPVTVANVGGQ